ncbi:hypothetical protein BYT27DRAFT_7093807 [Phlegmacium glaucopus]|nr:hypothetical protein BYT27DRAFT_7093807 [Phlegmacium glaucopus]
MRDDRLATVYKVRHQLVPKEYNHTTYHKQEINSFNSSFEVKEIEKPKTWHLLTLSTIEKDVEEAVFTVQGVIISKDLPPLREKPKITANRYRFLRQGVKLSGLGSPTFHNALMAANEIYGYFERQFSEGILELWGCSDDDKFPCIDISNRYLTPANEAHGLEDIPFDKGVDPQGILRSMAKGDGTTTHIHTEDNQVRYFNTRKDTEGNIKFTACEPQMYRVGDIVQAQFSFVVIPIKGNRRKMLSVLRSLALLDGSFSMVCNCLITK